MTISVRILPKLPQMAAAVVATLLASTAAWGEDGLQPYQLVRSLQLVQDRLASGDHAALPMQGKLLEMIDRRLREAGPEDFEEPKNFRALLVYAMSGGNPLTIATASARIKLDDTNKTLTEGVIDYLEGRPGPAIEALKSIDPMALPVDLGAFVALVKGSLLSTEDPAQALTLLDKARLLSPGTLVEEAALRRSVAIAAATGNAARFALASTQYVERYLYSPYASQFADSFVNGVVALHMAISREKIADITAMMDPERKKVIYLRIARSAAIDGYTDLSSFASENAEHDGDNTPGNDDPRALLYASLSTVTSQTVADAHDKLRKIDPNRLSERDRALLDAARAVISEVVTLPQDVSQNPTPSPKPANAPQTDQKSDQTSITPQVAATFDDPSLPLVEGIMEKPQAAAPQQISTVQVTTQAPDMAKTIAPIDTHDPTDEAIAKSRRTLAKIDQLLGAAPQ